MSIRTVLAATLIITGITACLPQATLAEEKVQKQKASLEEAFRAWHKGFSSGKKEEQEKTLRSMLATKQDIESLFPKHSDELWPKVEEHNRLVTDNLDKMVEEMTEGGAIKSIEAVNIRDKKQESYRRMLAILRMDVPVFEIIVRHEKGGSGGGTFLFVNNRWIWIAELHQLVMSRSTLGGSRLPSTASCSLLIADAPRHESRKPDRDIIQGKWKFVSAEADQGRPGEFRTKPIDPGTLMTFAREKPQ